jgi:hypothetical protein
MFADSGKKHFRWKRADVLAPCQTAFSTFSDQLLESANVRKIQVMREKFFLKNRLDALPKQSWARFMRKMRQDIGSYPWKESFLRYDLFHHMLLRPRLHLF